MAYQHEYRPFPLTARGRPGRRGPVDQGDEVTCTHVVVIRRRAATRESHRCIDVGVNFNLAANLGAAAKSGRQKGRDLRFRGGDAAQRTTTAKSCTLRSRMCAGGEKLYPTTCARARGAAARGEGCSRKLYPTVTRVRA